MTPSGFTDEVVWTGLTNPTAVRFAPDGRAFVAEKSGLIKVFDGLTDPTPTVFADLRTKVHNFWDRGLLSLALDPSFPTRPYVYVFYTYDAAIGGTAPRWGTAGATSDGCPTPPGSTGDGCVVSGRLSKLEAAGGGNTSTGTEQVLVEDWCQQYPSHSVGTIAFGRDGALYASGGDGASFTFTDYGQDGSPLNPCGDPPGGVGSTLTPPTAEGGALRSQDLRTSGDPVGLGGSVIRINPDTGAALPDNPLASNADPNARRVVAYGLRNPFRFSVRPGTDEIWIGDVGWVDWEEINLITDANDSVVENFGWPCYEGNPRQSGYDSANLNICENLYSQPSATTNPFFAYHHNNRVVAGESCPTGSSSVSGLAFAWYASGPYPASYEGALFFADYSRNCIWAMKKGANGVPAPGLIETFVADAAAPVDLQIGPTGELFYADFTGGTIHRIRFNAPPPPPAQEDKALNRLVSASSVDMAGHEPAKANDGSSTTRWSSSYANNQWWQVDLGSVRSVDSVRLNWEVAYGSQYQVLTSTDGVAFAVAATDGATAAGWRSTSFAVRQARFVRVLGVTRATSWGFSFWDAQVFGPADGSGDTTAPSVSLTQPAAGTVAGTVRVAASASDNVGVVGVQFQLDGANLLAEDVSAPYFVDWNSATSANGSHSLTAIARDAAGNRTTSAAVVINVANGGLAEDKALNRLVSASSVDMAGHEPAKANDGSSTTRWSSSYANNQWWQVDLGSVRSVDSVRLNWEVAYGSQYQVLTSTDGVAFAVAATDGATGPGWRLTSFAVRQARFVRVLGVTRATSWGFSFWDAQVFGPADGSGDTTAPSVSLTQPAAGTVAGTVRVAASASDNVGVVGVQFQLDGANLLAEDVSAPYFVDWNSATSANGSHSLTAIARDAAGNRTTSAAVVVTVSNGSPPPNTPPVSTISAPSSSTTWAVGDNVSFAGSASDAEDGALSGSSLQWTLILHHCPSNCHTHQIQTFSGSSGSFTTPDHDYPSHLELRLTATDSAGATGTTSVLLQPRTSTLSFQTTPTGLQLAVGSTSGVTPFSRTVIVGSANSVSAISPQTQNGRIWTFGSWSDGGAQTHTVTAVAAGGTFTATFTDTSPAQEDKALNRLVSASSVDMAGHEPAKANDGSSTTRWSSSYANNQWWQVDLGSVRSVDSVRLNWEVAYGSQYQVLTSTDGVAFAVAATDGATAAGWRSTSFAVRQARFVRVLGVTRATSWGFSFWDAQVFGPSDAVLSLRTLSSGLPPPQNVGEPRAR